MTKKRKPDAEIVVEREATTGQMVEALEPQLQRLAKKWDEHPNNPNRKNKIVLACSVGMYIKEAKEAKR